ncbi:CDP-diacylglycerol--serine O-phosphatidyltransferase [Anaerovibrio sp. JC8]|uniref:CDP-diacylglycerol--serine O-phosphatidyltransferase n=1 Tax=Anaerovibrio sp. JC8 TaxID=1240085 RepID=UPI000A0D8DE3|nr:CDP-diacylglycerol--serine O-phosphatidyltransferase [Anaerovibrio sp. JC8]ORU00252.1 CDP-diacylglycerol--serine O-phosphatidyltransferase [Anaerovibrio sp. JC8]
MSKSVIPNAFTSSNLIFGMISILCTFNDNLTAAAVCILLALVADGLDGRTARALGVSSELGKEMDSLCDLVSFGAAPAMLAYRLQLADFGIFGCIAAIFFALCGMWRLARFNVNTTVVHGYFMGLAIPAGGCLIATSTLLINAVGYNLDEISYAYPVIVMVVAYLMVSTVHYPDFKGDGEKMNLVAKVVAAAVFAAILWLGIDGIGYAVLFGIFASYAVFGIVNHSINLISGSK